MHLGVNAFKKEDDYENNKELWKVWNTISGDFINMLWFENNETLYVIRDCVRVSCIDCDVCLPFNYVEN